MKENGFILTGIYGGNKRNVRVSGTGVEVVKYQYLVIVEGTDTYKVTSEFDYSNEIMFGDQISFKVVPNVFNDRLYFRGELLKDA